MERYDIIEVRSNSTKFLTYVNGTEQYVRNVVFHRRKAESNPRIVARRQDGTYVLPPR